MANPEPSIEELEKKLHGLMESRRELRVRAREAARELESRITREGLRRDVEAMERKHGAQTLAAAGIPSAEKVNAPVSG